MQDEICKSIPFCLECGWRSLLSLRDPAGAAHPAGPPFGLSKVSA
jgi:hypothetical protein